MAAPIWKKLPCQITELHLDKTLLCGQSFRWKELEKGEWIGVFADRVWKLKQTSEEILYQVCGRRVQHVKTELSTARDNTQDNCGKQKKKSFQGLNDPDIKDFDKKSLIKIENAVNNGAVYQSEISYTSDGAALMDYFQLSINLTDLYRTWAEADSNFKKISKQFEGIRILRQEPVECLFAFICSSNNNIPRITSMVEKLASHYGELITEVDGIPYYSFPAVSALAGPGVEEKLRDLGFGYRARYIHSAKHIEGNGGTDWLYSLRDKKYKEARAELMKLCGVGAKVADCVCLFSLDKPGSIPVDTHVWKIAAEDYMPKLKQAKSLTHKLYDEIGDCFRDLWGPYAGWAHSVLFAADLRRFKSDAEKAKLSAVKRHPVIDDSKSKKMKKR